MTRKLRGNSGFGLVNSRSRDKDTGPAEGENDRHKTDNQSGTVDRDGIQHDASLRSTN
jgi:hypothetical protein